MPALNVVVGITGGIAAYKAVGLVRLLVLAGHDVHVVATENALRFIGRPTLEAISRNDVHTDLYDGVAEVKHVSVGQAADLIIVAPATANTIAKLAAGLADDFLSSTILATAARVVVAPAMHTGMWGNAATVANIGILEARGMIVVGPGVGRLTGDDSGAGRMSEPELIVDAALATVLYGRDLVGMSIVVTAGGTREPLDPVRFIGNRSSGRQGVALAAAAAARGATVTLIAANLDVDPPASVAVHLVGSAGELRSAALSASPSADVVIMAAAVADYTPERVSEAKISKEEQGDVLDLRLVRTPDILRELVEAGIAGQLVIGFAAETEPDDGALLELARAKVKRKGSHYLVVNRVGWTEGFASENNSVTIVDASGAIVSEAAGSKQFVANNILDLIPAFRAITR